MIKIYYRGSCHSSQRAFSWFKKYNLELEKKHINRIDRSDLIKLLHFSDEGLKDIVKRSTKSSLKVSKALKDIESLSFNESIEYIISHPYVLQTPIIIETNNHLIGYHEYEIRKFLPKEYRRCRLK